VPGGLGQRRSRFAVYVIAGQVLLTGAMWLGTLVR
jgi:hypothetical protein